MSEVINGILQPVNVGDKYVKVLWFEEVASGTTSGTISKPAGAGPDVSFLMDEWGTDTDALLSTMANGRPTYQSPVDAGGNIVTTTFDTDGNFSFSATPVPAAAHAVIYVYICQLKNFDYTESLFVSELTPAHNNLSSIDGGAANEYYHFTQAQHTEINGFFDNTDITGAEAETLTDGSDADALHLHPAFWNFFNGTFRETFNALVTSAAGVVTLSVEQSGGGDLTMLFSDGESTLDCTPSAATIALTAGSDTSPTKNFIYIPQSTKVLTKSTADWPSAEHIKVGYFLVPSAAFVAANGVYVNQNWNDHAAGTDNQGHMAHMAENIRHQYAIYHSGIDLTITIGGGTTVDASITAGVVFQMHKHAISALDTATGDPVLVTNQNGAAFDDVTDLETLTNDANGNSIANKYFNWVFWGIANKSGEFSPLCLNLPTGSYNTQSAAENDVSGYDVYVIPEEIQRQSSTAYLIKRVTMRLSGGTWSEISSVDLRGNNPQRVSGFGGGGGSTFADNAFQIYDDGDATKILTFQASGITTATTRVVTIADQDGLMVLNPFNDAGADVDFRMEGVGAEYAFFLQGSDGFIGLGTGAPQEQLHIISSVSQKPVVMLENTNSDANSPVIQFYKNSAAPVDEDVIGALHFYGNDSGANKTLYGQFEAWSTDVTDGDEGGHFRWSLRVDNVMKNMLEFKGYTGAVGQGRITFNVENIDMDTWLGTAVSDYSLAVEGNTGFVGVGVDSPQYGQFEVLRGVSYVWADGPGAALKQRMHMSCWNNLEGNNYYAGIQFKVGGTNYASGCIALVDPDGNGGTGSELVFATMNSGVTDQVERLMMSQAETIFNETGIDTDFRVEALSLPNAFKVQGSDGFVGLNIAAPDEMLHLYSATSAKPILKIENENVDANSASLQFSKLSSSPADGDFLGFISWWGQDSVATEMGYAYIGGYSLDVTNTDEAGGIKAYVRMDGTYRSLMELSGYNGSVNQGEIIFNEDGQDVDFRVEASGLPNAFKITGSTGDISQSGTATNSPKYFLDNYNVDATGGKLGLRKLSASMADNDVIGNIVFSGYDGDQSSIFDYVTMVAKARDITPSDRAGQFDLSLLSNSVLANMIHIDCFINGVPGECEFIINSGTQDCDFKVASSVAAESLMVQGDDGSVHMNSAVAGSPLFYITNSLNSNTAPNMYFRNTMTSPVDTMFLGTLNYYGYDSGADTLRQYVRIQGIADDVTAGDYAGRYRIEVRMDATLRSMLDIHGYNGSVNQGEIIFNDAGQDVDFRVEASGNADSLVVRGSDGRVGVGIGVGSLSGQLHVYQGDATAAIPPLYISQQDVSEEMIQFVTTIGVGNAIEAIGGKSLTTTQTTTHFIKVTIPGGLTRYIPCGTIA
jgi:hypothetical protein